MSATCGIELLGRVKPDDEREDLCTTLVDWVDVVYVALYCTDHDTVTRFAVEYEFSRIYGYGKCLRSNKHCALVGVALCAV